MCNESSLKSDPQKHNWLVKSENKWEKSKVLIWVYPSRCFLLALEMLTNFGSIFCLKRSTMTGIRDWKGYPFFFQLLRSNASLCGMIFFA